MAEWSVAQMVVRWPAVRARQAWGSNLGLAPHGWITLFTERQQGRISKGSRRMWSFLCLYEFVR
jgi:hypothetical protein